MAKSLKNNRSEPAERHSGNNWRRWNLTLYLALFVVLFVLFAICHATGTPFSLLTRDPLAITGGQAYFGMLSNIGILFWCAAAVICFFAWFVTRQLGQSDTGKLLFCFGALTLFLLFDDLFMLHEDVFPTVFSARQRYIMLTYMIVTLAALVRFRKTLLADPNLAFLLVAFGFFVLSVAADLFSAYTADEHWLHLWEDGSKLIGIVSWFNFFLQTGSRQVMQNYPQKYCDEHANQLR